MKITFFFIVFILLFTSTITHAQGISVKGKISDANLNIDLHSASVYAVQSKDSILAASTRSELDGSFLISGLKPDKYILYISYPYYAEYAENILVKQGKEVDLGNIKLKSKINILQEVIVEQKLASIRIKGDTTEYLADSFYVAPNATAEELLKRLPGLQINARGEIFAQSVKVEKVLVDGEEFFSDDPAVALQNIRADYIERVQVYDRKSKMAEFTGFDDGQRSRTINLKLKTDKKLNYFGKVEAGSDFDEHYSAKAMANFFNKQSKIATFISKNNTTYQTIDFDEQSTFSNNLNMVTKFHDDGNYSVEWQTDEFGWGRGKPTALGAGAVYNKRWNDDKQNIQNTYQFNDLSVTGDIVTNSELFYPGGKHYLSNQTKDVRSDKIRHLLNSQYDWKLDSTTTIQLNLRGNFVKFDDKTKQDESTSFDENKLLNASLQDIRSSGNNNLFKSSLLFMKKLGKKGRTISVAADFNVDDKKNDLYQEITNTFYSSNLTPDSIQKLDMYKSAKITQNKEGAKVAYTEPLSNNILLELSYMFTASQNKSTKETFDILDKTTNGLLVDSLSNKFKYNNTLHAGSVGMKIRKGKLLIDMGIGIGKSRYYLENMLTDETMKKNYYSVLPLARLTYKKTTTSQMVLEYTGKPINPSITQIQPLTNNDNPLNIIIGNPNLRQAYENVIKLNYNFTKPKNNQYFSGSVQFRNMHNDFTTSSMIDSVGKQTTSFVNVSNNYNAGLNIYYSRGIGKGINCYGEINGSISSYKNFVNNELNKTLNRQLELNFGFQKYDGGRTSFNINIRPSYTISSSSVDNDDKKSFWTFESNPDFTTKIFLNIYFSLNGEIHIYPKSPFPTPDNIFMLNASLRKSLSKANTWWVIASVNDILDKNSAIVRSTSSNFISQTSYSNIKRFCMLTISYNFTKK